MARACLDHVRLAGVLPVALCIACGQVDGRRSGASWCGEPGVGDVAAVTITESREDGVLVQSSVTLVDAAGRTLVEVLAPGAGSDAERTDYTLDAAGNAVEERFDVGADGTVDAASTTTYDDENRPSITEVDSDANGVVDSVLVWAYDVPNEVTRTYDQGNDGTPDSIELDVYSTQGDLVREERDDDADGNADRVRTHSFDEESGLLTEESEDIDADGVPENLILYQYDESDRLVLVFKAYESETGPDDVVDTYEYDEAGVLVSISRDLEIDDEIDQVQTFSYDDQGRTIRIESWSPVFEQVTSVSELEYGEGPDPVRTSVDIHADGTLDFVATRTEC